MIKAISEFIDGVLISQGLIEKYYHLVELASDGESRRPVHYIGNGQQEDVSDFDNFRGMAYLRQSGSPTASPDVDALACRNTLAMIYPLRLVFCIKRDLLAMDNEFTEDLLCMRIISLLTTKNGSVKSALKANSFLMYPTSWTTDSLQVISEEYQGKKLVDVNYDYVYGYIDFTANVTINTNCLPDLCEPCYGYAS